MNKPFTDYALDETAMEKWSAVEKLRDDVNAVLEAARAEKKIGKALRPTWPLHAGDDAASAALVQVMGLNLAELFIVSDCQVSSAEPDAASTVGQGANFPGLTVEVSEARGDKCERCWMHSPTVGADADHPHPLRPLRRRGAETPPVLTIRKQQSKRSRPLAGPFSCRFNSPGHVPFSASGYPLPQRAAGYIPLQSGRRSGACTAGPALPGVRFVLMMVERRSIWRVLTIWYRAL